MIMFTIIKVIIDVQTYTCVIVKTHHVEKIDQSIIVTDLYITFHGSIAYHLPDELYIN